MKQLIKKILASTKTTIVLSIIIIVILPFCWERIVYDFECLAGYLYGTSADNKGKLLSTILTAIGGICVIWGLYLNNKKVDEQTRQNNITVQNSNDKRFGEAIGYLSNDHYNTVLGGIYILYQLAKEDKKYAETIYNILVRCLEEYSKNIKLRAELIDIIFFQQPCPFSFIKKLEQEYYFKKIVFREVYFRNLPQYTIFQNCIFNSATVIDGYFIEFKSCTIKSLYVKNCLYLHINDGDVNYIGISGAPVCIKLYPKNLNKAKISCSEVDTIDIAPFMLTESVIIREGTIKTLNIEEFHTSDPTARVYISPNCNIGFKGYETDKYTITDKF